MKTFSSLVKMISDGENNFMQNRCIKRMRYSNILPNQKLSNLLSSTIYLLGVDMIDIANSKLIIETNFSMI